MKKRNLSLFIILLAAILVPSRISATSFQDSKGHWAEEYIKYCVDKGYVHGYPDGTFKPNQPITKAEYYKITNHANPDAFKNETGENNFKDVDESEWFYNEVLTGIAMGYLENNTDILNPTEPITREDAVRIFSYNKGFNKNEKAVDIFKDKDSITDRYKGLVGAAVENKLIVGYPDGNFGPKNSLTRAEVVTIIVKSELYGLKPIPTPLPSGQWHWSFKNNSANFKNGYALTELDKKLAAENFSPKDAQEIYRNSRNSWRGSCFGFTSTSGLYKIGKFNIANLNNPGKSSISDIAPQDNYLAQSRINIYQLSQTTRQFSDFRHNKGYGFNAPYIKNSTRDLKVFTDKFISLIDSEKSRGSVVQLAVFGRPKLSHAVVAYDYVKSGNIVKIKVYDPNFPNTTDSRFLEIDLGAKTVKYNGSDNADLGAKSQAVNQMYIFSNTEFSKNFDLNAFNNNTIINLYGERPVEVLVNGASYILDPKSINSEKSLDGDYYTFTLPETNGEIIVNGRGKINLSIIRGDSRQEINSDDFYGAVASDETITLKGNPKNLEIAITKDKPTALFPQDTVRVKGNSAENLKLSRDDSGYALSASNLNGIEVIGSKYYNDESFKINADTSSVSLRNQNGNFTIIDNTGLRYDSQYINPDTGDNLVGSWHGKMTYDGIDYPLESYLYITKIGNGKYEFKQRVVARDGSEFTTISHATFDKSTNSFSQQESHKLENKTGIFKNDDPYLRATNYKLNGNNLKSTTFKDVEYNKY